MVHRTALTLIQERILCPEVKLIHQAIETFEVFCQPVAILTLKEIGKVIESHHQKK
jgi:hypothetical protein